MKAKLFALFAMLKTPLGGLLSSKKVWTVVLGLITAQTAKYGLEVDEKTYWTIVGMFTVLLGTQGLQDVGKEAAKQKQAGSTRLHLMLLIATVGIAVSCGASARDTALRTQLTTLNVARDTFVAVSDARQSQIVDQATSIDEGRARLKEFRTKRSPVVEAFARAYEAIAAAAVLNDAKSVAGVAGAVENVVTLVKELRNGE